MIVYIEDAILDNLIINSIILFLTLFSLRLKIKVLKVFFASSIGCAISVAITLVNLNTIFVIILKLLVGIILCVITIPKLSFKVLSLFYVVFLSFTFLMGGFCFFIIFLLGGEVYSVTTLSYNLPVSIGVIFLLLGVYVYFLISAIKVFYKKQKLSSFYYDVKIKISNKTIKIKAYLDSGNLLQDSSTGLPILIVNFNTFNRMFNKKIGLFNFLKGTLDHIIKGRYIQVSSVNGNGKMFVVSPDCVEIKQQKLNYKKINVLIGVSAVPCKYGQFEALLSPLAL